MTKERAIKVINVFLGNNNLCSCDGNCLHVSCKECRREAAQMAIEALKEQKTGKWIKIAEGLKVTEYKCSECGRFVKDDTGYDVVKDYPYCHCGARME